MTDEDYVETLKIDKLRFVESEQLQQRRSHACSRKNYFKLPFTFSTKKVHVRLILTFTILISFLTSKCVTLVLQHLYYGDYESQ